MSYYDQIKLLEQLKRDYPNHTLGEIIQKLTILELEEIPEIPQFKGTREQLNNLTIIK